MKKKLFQGVATALITPFNADGSIDFIGLEYLIEFQIKNGVQAIVIAGTTGEASTLSFEEYSLLISKAAFFIRHRVPLIAGSGSNNTAKAIKLSLEAQKRGADALLIVTPYYNKTTQNGLLAHYFSIADRVKIPIIAYDIPARTGLKISPITIKKLSEHENIIAIKDASNDISTLAETLSLSPDINVYSGNDDQIIPILSLGGSGVISVLSNIIPYEIQQICDLFFANNHKKAAEEQIRLIPLVRSIFAEVNPIGIKGIMKNSAYPSGDPRLPLIPCTPTTIEQIKNELSKIHLMSKK